MGQLSEFSDADLSIVDYARYAHRGDPCIYCSTPHDKVKPGPCPKLVEYADRIKKAEQRSY